MATSDEALTLLRSIDASLKRLLQVLSGPARHEVTPAFGAPEIAPDRDLDGKYGDPIVRATDPRDWNGPSMKGNHFSQCPPEYLDMLAERFDYFAEKAERQGITASNGQPAAPYNRRDAARARGWAKRLRNGWTPPEPEGWNDAVPF